MSTFNDYSESNNFTHNSNDFTSSNDNSNSSSSFILDDCVSDLFATNNNSKITISENSNDSFAKSKRDTKTVDNGIFTIPESRRRKYFTFRVDHEKNTIYYGCKIRGFTENATKVYCRGIATHRLTNRPVIVISKKLCEMLRDIPTRDVKSRTELFYHCLVQVARIHGVENKSCCLTNEDVIKMSSRSLKTIQKIKVQKNKQYLAKIRKDLLTNTKGKMLNQFKKIAKRANSKNMSVITYIKTTNVKMITDLVNNRKALLVELSDLVKKSNARNAPIITEISSVHSNKQITSSSNLHSSSLEIATSSNVKLIESEIHRIENEKLKTERQTKALEKQMENERVIKEFINSPNKLKFLLSKYTKSSPILINQDYDHPSFPQTLNEVVSNVTFIIHNKKRNVTRVLPSKKANNNNNQETNKNSTRIRKCTLRSTKIMVISYNEKYDVATYSGCVYSEIPGKKMIYDEAYGKAIALQRFIKTPVIINNFSKTSTSCVDKIINSITVPTTKLNRLDCERKMQSIFEKILLQYLYNPQYGCSNRNSNTSANIQKLNKIIKMIPSLQRTLNPPTIKQKRNLKREEQTRKYLIDQAQLQNNAVMKVARTKNIISKSLPSSNLNIVTIEVPSTLYIDTNEPVSKNESRVNKTTIFTEENKHKSINALC